MQWFFQDKETELFGDSWTVDSYGNGIFGKVDQRKQVRAQFHAAAVELEFLGCGQQNPPLRIAQSVIRAKG